MLYIIFIKVRIYIKYLFVILKLEGKFFVIF